MDARETAERNLIFMCVSGSRAYGTSTPSSDLDLRGVFVADRISVVSPFAGVEQVEGPGDTVRYELSKYVRLLADQNPSILEFVWAPEDCVRVETPTWQMLRERRGDFLCRKLRATYGGFAMSQLKRIKGHSKWINNPQPEERPRPADFVSLVHDLTEDRRYLKNGLPKEGKITAVEIGNDLMLFYKSDDEAGWIDHSGALRTFARNDVREIVEGVQPLAICKFNREEYKAAKSNWDNYWTWKRNRNEARAELEAQHGFDTKHAGHLIRLLRTAREALREGVICVRRPDAAELLAIKNGAYSYEQILAMAEEIEADLDSAERESCLPAQIDQAALSDLVGEMYERFWSSARAMTKVAVRRGGAPDPHERLCIVDIEHSGYARAVKFKICEIGAVEIVGGQLTGRTFHAYVDPKTAISPYATKIHGLTNKFLEGKPGFVEAAKGFLEFVGDAPMIMHSAISDLQVLNADLTLAKMETIPERRAHCTQIMARQLFPGASLSLDTLCDILGVDRTARERGHSAMVDAHLTAECLLTLARLDGYGAIRRSSPKPVRRGRVAVSQPTCQILADENKAVFSLRDGGFLEAALPDMPSGYRAVVSRGSVLVVQEGVAPHGKPKPENPIGPAVLYVKDGAVRETFIGFDPQPQPPAP